MERKQIKGHLHHTQIRQKVKWAIAARNEGWRIFFFAQKDQLSLPAFISMLDASSTTGFVSKVSSIPFNISI